MPQSAATGLVLALDRMDATLQVRCVNDAIAHCRAFNEQVKARAAGWDFEPEPGLHVGEKVTPITSAGACGMGVDGAQPRISRIVVVLTQNS